MARQIFDRMVLAFCLLASAAMFYGMAHDPWAFAQSFGPTLSPTNIVAGQTQTSGITSGDIIGSTGNLAVDSGVAWANVGLLNGTQTWTAVNTFNAQSTFIGEAFFNFGSVALIGTGGFAAFTQLQSALSGSTNNTVIIPNLSGSDTFDMLGQAQTLTGVKTFSANPVLGSGILYTANSTAPTVASGKVWAGVVRGTSGAGFCSFEIVTSTNTQVVTANVPGGGC